MSAAQRILRNIASNSIGYVVNVIVALLLAPYLVDRLGNEIYGIWTLIVSLTGYYGLLDLGIRSAVGHFVAVYWARHDLDAVNRTMSTAMALLLVAAGVAVVVTLVLFFVFPVWKPEALEREPRALWALLVMGFGLACSFPMAIYSTVIYARQRIDLQNAVGITQRLLSALLIVLALRAGHGLVGVAAAVMGTNALTWAANVVLAHRLMPQLRIDLRAFSRLSLTELKGYGFYNFIVNAADNILLYTDAVVIGIFIPSLAAVTYYQVGANLIPYYMSIVFAVTWAITPYATACYATGDYAALRRLMVLGTRGVLSLATLIGGGLLFLGHDFLALWMGREFVSGRVYPSSALILAILTCATLLRAAQSCGRQLLFAMQEVRFLGLLALAEAAANLVLSVLLVGPLGIVGVALGTLLPILVTQGMVQPLFLMRKLGLSATDFFRSVLRSMAPILLGMDACYFLWVRDLPADTWAQFVEKGVALAVLPALLGVFLGLGPEERRLLLRFVTSRRKVGTVA